MKRLFWLVIATLALVACNKELPEQTVLSGKVENAQGLKEIRVRGSYSFSQVLEVKEDGTFLDTLKPIKSGFYSLQIGRANFPVYLEQEDKLNLVVDLSNREAPVSFKEGKSVGVNDYLTKKSNETQEEVAKMGGFQGIFGMDEKAFVEAMNKMKEGKLAKLKENANFPERFVELEEKTIEYEHLYNLSLYPEYHGYVIKDENFKASEIVTKPLDGVVYNNNEDYNTIAGYKQLVLGHFMNAYYKEGADRGAVIEELKATGIEVLRKDFAQNLSQGLKLGHKDAKEEVDRIKGLTTDEEINKKLDEFLTLSGKLSEGQPSPKFEYDNIKGKKVSLDDLKGKLVYIDVWATWCGPCKGELPYLQKLEKDYHGKAVHFVSISIDEDKAAWENMVKSQKLGGIQLHAEGAWKSGFAQSYKIQGIPRFILLDKAGNIISADAPRPSSDKIRVMLDEWMKK